MNKKLLLALSLIVVSGQISFSLPSIFNVQKRVAVPISMLGILGLCHVNSEIKYAWMMKRYSQFNHKWDILVSAASSSDKSNFELAQAEFKAANAQLQIDYAKYDHTWLFWNLK